MASPPPDWGLGEEVVEGEYSDRVSIWGIVTTAIFAVFWVVIVWAGKPFSNPGTALFVLLFPLVGLFVTVRCLTVATLTIDGDGWRYTRRVFGRAIENEEGRWADVVRTQFGQRLMQGRSNLTVYGEFSLFDCRGRVVLRVRTQLYSRGNLYSGHAVGRRQIGLSEVGFSRFVRFINGVTPQLAYEWVPSTSPEDIPVRGVLFKRAGPDQYVRVLRVLALPADNRAR